MLNYDRSLCTQLHVIFSVNINYSNKPDVYDRVMNPVLDAR